MQRRQFLKGIAGLPVAATLQAAAATVDNHADLDELQHIEGLLEAFMNNVKKIHDIYDQMDADESKSFERELKIARQNEKDSWLALLGYQDKSVAGFKLRCDCIDVAFSEGGLSNFMMEPHEFTTFLKSLAYFS